MIVKSKLNLVDLAESENPQNDIAILGDHFKEFKKINLSLSTLRKVIYGFTKGETHITYRKSKLTRLLQDCIGGNIIQLLLLIYRHQRNTMMKQ